MVLKAWHCKTCYNFAQRITGNIPFVNTQDTFGDHSKHLNGMGLVPESTIPMGYKQNIWQNLSVF